MTWAKSLNWPDHLQHIQEEMCQTTNPSNERDSPEKGEERNRK